MKRLEATIPEADAPFDIVWDDLGVAHVYAATVADAYRGMGYAAASERLWQIHLSNAYANGEAAALLGKRFVVQDALQRACNVHGGLSERPASEGDWIADAYLEGMNAYVAGLSEVPPEFQHAGAQPRLFNRADVAARYRFTSWFQHKTWTEKLLLGHLMAKHGVDRFREHVLHFSEEDEAVVERLGARLLDPAPAFFGLGYPEAATLNLSGSNNWAVTGARSASGTPILATDPHQPQTIPNTFFYVHLHVGDWDVFGAAFPGVPYFMMGYTRDIAWGLTTGFVDCYDVYMEEVDGDRVRTAAGWQPLETRTERILIKGGGHRDVTVRRTRHGPLLESLTDELGLTDGAAGQHQFALHWSLADVPSSAGALSRLPLAKDAETFGQQLFENDVCPLVNNIICVDRHNGLRRFIATVLPARRGVTGSVPLPGWDERYDFPRSKADDLVVEIDPPTGIALTANNDTMGETGPYYIHNFPANSARADRIREHLAAQSQFTVADFQRMQLDLLDLQARSTLPALLEVLTRSEDERCRLAVRLLSAWDHCATPSSSAACLYYPFNDRMWYRRFLRETLEDPLTDAIPVGAPGLGGMQITAFLTEGSPWQAESESLRSVIVETMCSVVDAVRQTLGDDEGAWRWGDMHQISFAHTLAKHEPWAHMKLGPDPIGGSPNTLGMAMRMGPGPGRAEAGQIPYRVYHGPAYRLVVDLGDPDHAKFVICGGNGGRPDSRYALNHYATWLNGEHLDLKLRRDEISPQVEISVTAS